MSFFIGTLAALSAKPFIHLPQYSLGALHRYAHTLTLLSLFRGPLLLPSATKIYAARINIKSLRFPVANTFIKWILKSRDISVSQCSMP